MKRMKRMNADRKSLADLCLSVFICGFLGLLCGCGAAPKKPPQTSSKYYSDDGPPASVPDNIDTIPNAVPRDASLREVSWLERALIFFEEGWPAAHHSRTLLTLLGAVPEARRPLRLCPRSRSLACSAGRIGAGR